MKTKIRGFYLPEKVMVYFDKAGFCDEYSCLAFSPTDEKYIGYNQLPNGFNNGDKGVLENYWIMMLFTGQTDNAGNDIYDKDILKTPDGDLLLVNWSDTFAGFCLDKKGWAYSHFFCEAVDSKVCVVVGNVLQNPDLLEKQETGKNP